MGDDEVSKVLHELSRLQISVKQLEALAADQKDEIRHLKCQARSYEDEIRAIRYEARQAIQVRQDTIADYKKEVQRLEGLLTKSAENFTALNEQWTTLEGSYEKERDALFLKVETLEVGKSSEARSYEEQISALNLKVHALEEEAAQGTPAHNIGREVRLRFMEKYRRGVGRKIGEIGHNRIKLGDRAAHRGRPIVDAHLCLSGEMADKRVFPDLYGVSPETMQSWKDVSEMVDVAGFRASLQTEKRLTPDFQQPFERLVKLAAEYKSGPELIAAFAEKDALKQLYSQLQNCYDKIVAANAYTRSKDNGYSSSGRLDYSCERLAL